MIQCKPPVTPWCNNLSLAEKRPVRIKSSLSNSNLIFAGSAGFSLSRSHIVNIYTFGTLMTFLGNRSMSLKAHNYNVMTTWKCLFMLDWFVFHYANTHILYCTQYTNKMCLSVLAVNTEEEPKHTYICASSCSQNFHKRIKQCYRMLLLHLVTT